MMTLGLETSEAWGGVALCRGGTLLGEAMLEGPLRHAEGLLPALERLLAECRVRRDEIELVSANRGPGSFTGLRIGLATAKGIGQALGIPVVGIDGTAVYRGRVEADLPAWVVIPCRLDLLYVRAFGRRKPTGETEVMKTSSFLDRLAGNRKEAWVVGSGAEPLRERLAAIPSLRVAPAEVNRPSPAWVARLGEETYTGDELYGLEPAYVDVAIREKRI